MKKLFFLFSIIYLNSYGQCEKITKTVDKYTDKITWETPLYLNENSNYISPFVFHKIYTKGDTLYAMSLKCHGVSASVTDGVYILFYNGSKIIREDEKIDVSVETDLKFRYSTTILLTKDEVKLFKSFSVSDFRLSIYDGTLGDEKYLYKDLVKCLVKAK